MHFAYLLYLADRVYRLMGIDPAASAGPHAGPEDPILPPPALLRELEQALHSIRYGTIELVIHDGRVVQLERREKVRFEAEVSKHRR
jgi:hypothetical protein